MAVPEQRAILHGTQSKKGVENMNDRKGLWLIGGSAAGPKAAAKARRMDEHAEVMILQKDPDLSMASCGYPYYVGGCFDDRNMLLSPPRGDKGSHVLPQCKGHRCQDEYRGDHH